MANFFKNLFFKSLFSKNKSASPCPKKIYRRRLELEGMEPRITPATISIVDNQVVLTLVNGEDISNLNTALVGNTLTITNTSLNNNTSSGVIPVGITVNDHDVVVDTTNFTTFAGLVVNAAGGSQPVTVVVNSSGIDLSAVPGNANQSVSIDLSLSADPADSVTVNSAIKTKGTGTVDLNATTISLAAAGDITTNAGNVNITGPTKIETAGDITTSGGNITFHNALTLTDDIILTGNTPTFTGGVTGANHDLTLNFSGTTTIGANFTGIKNLTTNSGGTTSLSSAITTSGNQTYNDAVTLSANTTLNSGGSNIIFGSTLDGAAFNLGLTAGAGTISGTSVNISNLTITSGTSATFTGAVTVNALITKATATTISLTGTGNTFALNVDFLNSGLVTLGDGNDTFLFNTGLNFTGNAASKVGGFINTSGDVINFGTGGVTLVASSSVNSTVGGVGAGITFGGKLDGAFDLSLNAGAGTITFTGLVGNTAPLNSLTVLSAGDLAISAALKAAGLVAITGNADVNVFLGTAGAGLSLADAELNFITTTGGLSITASGTGIMTVNKVTGGGTISGTTTLTAGGTGVTFATTASTFNNALTIASPAILGVNISTSDDTITFNKSVTLAAITTLASGKGDILFGSTVDGAFALTANSSGTTTFSDIVGGTAALASLSTNTGGTTAINGGAITTTTIQTYTDAVTLGANTILTGTIPTFTGGVTGAGNDLTLNFSGITTIGANITGIKNLTTNNGGTTSLSGIITTTGTQTYNDAVNLTADTTLTGTIPTFLVGVTGALNNLTLNFSGTTTIGATFTGIKNLTTNNGGTTSLSGIITTTGSQTYNDVVTLTADTTLTGTTPIFTLGVTGAGNNLTLTFSGLTTIGVNFTGIKNLTANGGGTTSLSGIITTTGTQTYTDAITLTANTTLTGTTSTFTGGVTGAGYDLTLNFSGLTTIGATFTGIKNLTTNSGGTTSLSGAITTTGNQTYNDAVILSAITTLNSGGSNIFFGSTLSGAFNLDLTAGAGTISGTSVNITNLTIVSCASATFTGAVTVNDLITTANPYAISLTGSGNNFAVNVDFLNSGLVTLGAVAGTATFLFNTGLNFGGNAPSKVGGANISSSGDLINFGAGGLTLISNSIINSTVGGVGAGITFGGKLNGTFDLSLTALAGTITFTGLVGDTAPLNSLTISSAGDIAISAALKTAGLVAITGNTGVNVFLGTVGVGLSLDDAELSFITTTGGLSITASGIGIMTVNKVTGGGTVSGTTTLTAGGTGVSFITNASNFDNALNVASPAIIGVNISTSNDALTFSNPVTLTANSTLATGAGAILFDGTVNGAFNLIANSSSDTTFSGIVGGTVALKSISANAGGTTYINTSAITTTGNQSYNDAVTLSTNNTMTSSNNILFANSLKGAFNLGLNAGAGAGLIIGTSVNINNLTITNGASAAFTGAVTVNDLITTANPYTISMTGIGNTFAQNVDFLNSGAIALGDTSDTFAFSNGFTFTGNSPSDISAIINSGGIVNFGTGGVTLRTNSAIATTQLSAAGQNILFGAAIGGAFDLNLNAGTGGAITGKSVTINDLTISNGASAAFTGAVKVNDLITTATATSISMTGTGNTFAQNVDFLNSGLVTLGGVAGTETFLFNNGLNFTGNAASKVGGFINSSGDVINFGTGGVTLVLSSSVNSTVGGGGADITFGGLVAVTADNAQALTVNASTNNIITFGDDVGAPALRLSALTLTANSVKYGGDVYVASSTNFGNVVLTANQTFTTNGTASIGTVNGSGFNMNIVAGDLALTGDVTNIGTLSIENISAAGTITLMGTGGLAIETQTEWNFIQPTVNFVVLGNTLTNVGVIDVAAAWINNRAVTVDFKSGGAGKFNVNGAITTTTGLGSLTVNGSGNSTNINADITQASINITDSVVVDGGVLRILTATAVGGVVIDSTGFVNGISANAPATSLALTTIFATAPISLTGTLTNTGGNFLTDLQMGGNSVIAGTVTLSASGSIDGDLSLGNSSGIDLDSNAGILSAKSMGFGVATSLTGSTSLQTTAGDISFNDAIFGGANSLTLNASGTILATSLLTTNDLTITNSNGTTFTGTVGANNVVITDSSDASTVAFQDNLAITTGMTVAAGGAYNVSITGFSNSIAGDTNFLNTGSVTIGQVIGTSSFLGGLDTTAASSTNIAGTVETTNTAMDLGATTLADNATLRSGSGPINVASITDGANSFALGMGNGTQTGTITITGNTTVDSLNTSAGAYSIELTGAANTIIINTNFLNTGSVTIGQALGTSSFVGGLNTTAASSTNIAGVVQTTNSQINLGSTILLANASLLSGSGQILAASITDGASSFALSLGNASQTGTITVTGNTSVDTLNTGAGAYSIELTGATNTITTNTNFLNTVSVTLGDSAGTDSFLFDGGLNFTGNAASKLGGFINSSGDAINFGTGPGGVTLTANSTIASTTTSPAGANIIFGSGITGAFDLGLDAGTGGAITGTSVAINDLTVTNGASAAFTGAVTINDLITTAKPYSVSMTGTGNTFAQYLNFANSGLVTLGDGTDTFLLNNGLTFGGNAASKLGGTINSSGDVINFGTGGSTLTNNSTVATITSSPAGAAILFGAGITGAFNLGLDAGTGGAITGTSVAINDLTINNGASAAFTGAVTVNDLITTTNPYSVSMTGTGNTFAQNVEFLNTGTVALNNAISDSSTFAGGLVVTAPSSITMKGTVAATNSNMILGDSDTGVILGTNTTLNAGTGNINLNGVVSGAFSLTPITATPGLTTIAGANTNTTTNVTTGVVQINNSLPQTTNYAVSGGTLKGTGAIGALTGTGTGIIAPGNSPGQVTTTNLSLTSTNTLQIELTGTTPGTQYDQIVVNPGTVTLDNAILTLSSTYAGSAGAVFTIIDNQGIAAIGGTFVGLPEGSVISTSGRAYKISYVGGTGNDVTLTAIPTVTLNIADLDITTTTLTITGTGFDTTPGNNTVTFNDGAIGTVNSATSTQLNIIFSTQPTGTGSLTAVVITNSISSGAPIQVATVVTTPTPTPTPTIVTGTPPPSSGGSSTVTIYDPATGQPSGTVVPFPGFSGELRVVTGDFNGDGIMDILAAAGPGGGPAIAVLNSQTGAVMESFFAFDPAFTGGVFVAVSDFNGDGILDIIAGAGAGGGPEVRIFDGSNLNILKAFFAYDQSFTGGVTVAAQDFNADGILDIVTGAGAGGAPHVKVFDGATNSILSQWYAYPISFTGGVYVAAGDISNDGNVEVVTGAGMGGSPVVAVWDPYTGALLSQFMAYAEDFTGGVRVGVSDGNGDGINDLITGAGPGGGPQVKGFSFPALDLLFSFYSGDSTNTGGVFVS